VPFVYTSDGQLYWADDPKLAHGDLMSMVPELRERYGGGTQRSTAFGMGDLLGRAGDCQDGHRVVSFWNRSKHDYVHLPDCLRRLLADGVLDTNAFVSTPVPTIEDEGRTKVYTFPLSHVQGLRLGEMDDQDRQRAELYQQLHLMRGDAKKQAMQHLGLGAQGKRPWQRAAEQTGMISPGQKWWAPTSEGLVRKLDALFAKR